MEIIGSIILAASLCADCFAVSLCSSITLRKVEIKSVLRVALSFAIIQTGLLLCGWLFGSIFVGLLSKIANIVAFLLLAYVGGSMLLDGIRGKVEVKNLNGWKNIILGGIATSIDALAVGVAKSMDAQGWQSVAALLISVFVISFGSVVAGIFGGNYIGKRMGSRAEIAGGLILIAIGVLILL